MSSNVSLADAISKFNESVQPQIVLGSDRRGATRAMLPRLNREIIVEGGRFGGEVTASDIALLAEEARLAIAPGLALLEAALAALTTMEQTQPSEDTGSTESAG